MRFVFSVLFLLSVFIAASVLDSTSVLAICSTDAVCRSPGPLPGGGLLSYVALGAIGVGTAAWKRLRK
jgi:hypothetical protein